MKIILKLVIGVCIIPIAYYFYPEPKLPTNIKIDYLQVFKSRHQLKAFSNGKIIKIYTISLGKTPTGDKQFEGDKKTPEGIYYINDKNPYSGWHKNLGISYPNKSDISSARKLRKSAGGNIKIHGIRNGFGFIHKFHRWFDWTNGCIALTNAEIDELYKAVKIGSPIEIRP